MPEFAKTNLSSSIEYMHLKSESRLDFEYHLHDKYEIYFLISGKVEYFVERNIYLLENQDVLIMNNREIHKPFVKNVDNYERIIIEFDPSVFSSFRSSDFNLLGCFVNRQKGQYNRLSFSSGEAAELARLLENFESLGEDPAGGSEMLKLAYMIELLVFLNKAFMTHNHTEKRMKVPDKILPILDFIDSNIENDLTLKTLASEFYIDKYHLSRTFKNITGINIHDYILAKRIARAKQLLEKGMNILDTSLMSGFKNYTTFIRTFKHIVGELPKDYQKGSRQTSGF